MLTNYTVLLAHKIHKNAQVPPNCTEVSNICPPSTKALPIIANRSLKMVNLTPYQGITKIIFKIHVCTSLRKSCFFCCSIRLCSDIPWIRQFYLLTKLPKRRIRCHQTILRFQIFPGEHALAGPTSKASHLPCSKILAPI